MLPIDPIVLFFILGLAAGLARSDLRLPSAVYEFLSVILLLAIGLKGGVELAQQSLVALLPQMIAVVLMGLALPLVAYPVLRLVGRLARADADTEKPRRDLRQLVRLVDHHGIGAGQQLAEAVLLERQVRQQQVMVDHHHVGCSAACPGGLSPALLTKAARAGTGAFLGADREHAPVGIVGVGQAGAFAVVGPFCSGHHGRRQVPVVGQQ
jgi:hypothetical protein